MHSNVFHTTEKDGLDMVVGRDLFNFYQSILKFRILLFSFDLSHHWFIFLSLWAQFKIYIPLLLKMYWIVLGRVSHFISSLPNLHPVTGGISDQFRKSSISRWIEMKLWNTKYDAWIAAALGIAVFHVGGSRSKQLKTRLLELSYLDPTLSPGSE